MIIRILSLGSVWWFRGPIAEPNQCAVMNTTGFVVSGNTYWSHTQKGFVRFNTLTHRTKQQPRDFLQGNYQSDGITMFRGSNKLLVGKQYTDEVPDMYLVCVRSSDYGLIAFTEEWRSGDVRLVSASFRRGEQETQLLMGHSGSIVTTLGKWSITWAKQVALLTLVAA